MVDKKSEPPKKNDPKKIKNNSIINFIMIGIVILLVVSLSVYMYLNSVGYFTTKSLSKYKATIDPKLIEVYKDDLLIPKVKEFSDAKFGLFIHYGVYSQIGNGSAEWALELDRRQASEYKKLAKTFNPVNLNPTEWANLFSEVGFKYICITSKHHDGFALFDQRISNMTPEWTSYYGKQPNRDILAEIKAAVLQKGIKFCLYHTIMDWIHKDYQVRRSWNDLWPGYTASNSAFETYVSDSMTDVIKRYDPTMLWLDGGWESCWTEQNGLNLRKAIESVSKKVVYNDRSSKKAGLSHNINLAAEGDFITTERIQPSTDMPKTLMWETCETVGRSWGYNSADENPVNYKSIEQIIRLIVESAGNGGNTLLNMGPRADGTFPPEMITHVLKLKPELLALGEGIYGTRKGLTSKYFDIGGCRSTIKKTSTGFSIYIFIEAGYVQDFKTFRVPINKVSKIVLVENNKNISFIQQDVLITLRESLPQPTKSKVYQLIRVEFTEPELYFY